MHYVYIIYSPSLDRFYTGETVDVNARLAQHNTGHYQGASTSAATDWEIFLEVECRDRSHALQLERFIKKQKSSRFIRKLKDQPEVLESVMSRF